MAKVITAAQLVGYFQKAVADGWGYVWSLNGELYSRELAEHYHKIQRPTSKHRDPKTYWIKDCAKWIGKMAADCSGGIVGAHRQYNPSYQDQSANTFYSRCIEKGPISTIPEIPGLCVWRDGHIGIYEGNGNVLEFRGTDYGAVRTELKSRNFTHWGRLRDAEYAEGKPMIFEVTSPYQRGPAYEAMQTALNAAGYDCGKADGVWGPKSQNALQGFVEAHMPIGVSITVEAGGVTYRGDAVR